MYEQIAKALWQLQMKGDINKALQNTDIWNRPTQNNSPRSHQGNLNRQGDGLVVRELILDDNISPTHIRVRTTSHPSLLLGPTHIQPSTTKDRRTAFARRATERQITLHTPTTAQTEQATVAPERVYSNKMNRNTAKGYGSSLTKLIADKIKFDPPQEPALPSNPVIDSILGPLVNQGGNVLPSNFLPLPSTTTGIVPNTGNSQKTTVQMKEKQRTVLAKPVKSTPVVVFPENGGQQVPSPSFSIVAPSLGQNPASFRFSNKEVSSNQLQDKNNRGQNPGFDNLKDMELNDVSQVIVDQAAPVSVKPDNVKKPEIVKVQEQKKENSQVDPQTVMDPTQPDITKTMDQSVQTHQQTPTKSGDMPRTTTERILSTKPDEAGKHRETPNKVEVSRSDVAIDNNPSNNQRVWQEATIRNSEIQRPEVQVVQSVLPALSGTSEDVLTTPQTTDTTDTQTDLPMQDLDFTTEVPTSTVSVTTQDPTTTTEAPVRVGISRGSPRGTRPGSSSISRGSFRGVRPSTRGTRPIGRGTRPVGRGTQSIGRGTPTVGRGSFSPSRGSLRGGRPIGIRRQEPVPSVNIPEVGQTTPAILIVDTDMTTTQASTTTQAAETEPTTTEQTPQVPAMNTAQFARRARPGRVVVNTLGNTKQRPVVARGVGQARAPIVQSVRIPAPSEMLSFDRPFAVEQPARAEQIPIVLNSVSVEQPTRDVQTPLVLNSEVAAENDWSLTSSTSTSTSATTTEQPPTTTTPSTTPAPTTAASARRPQAIRPGSKYCFYTTSNLKTNIVINGIHYSDCISNRLHEKLN